MSYRLGSHVSVIDTDGGTVLLNQRTGRYWQLNPTGAAVLQALRDGSGIDDAVRRLVAVYPAAADRVAGDVAALTESLLAAGVIER